MTQSGVMGSIPSMTDFLLSFGFMNKGSHMNWDKERHRPWTEGADWLFDFDDAPR